MCAQKLTGGQLNLADGIKNEKRQGKLKTTSSSAVADKPARRAASRQTAKF